MKNSEFERLINEVIEDLEDWGSYVDLNFKKKWGFDQTIEKYKKLLEKEKTEVEDIYSIIEEWADQEDIDFFKIEKLWKKF
jgi:hypothetical protein